MPSGGSEQGAIDQALELQAGYTAGSAGGFVDYADDPGAEALFDVGIGLRA